MNLQSYQRLIIGYHGCDAKVADQVLRTGGVLAPSENEYDWLGSEILRDWHSCIPRMATGIGMGIMDRERTRKGAKF